MPDVTFSIGGTSNAQPVITSTMEALMQMAEQSKVAAAQLAESFSKSSAMFAQQQEAIRNYASQLGMVGVKQEELATQTASAGPGGLMGALGGLWQGFQQGAGAVGGFAEKILGAINPLQLFHSNVMRLAEVMMLWRAFEYGTRMIQDFIGAIAQLPVTMERTEMAWTYMFGMQVPGIAAMTNPQQQFAAAQGVSRNLAAWSAQYSYNIPYTRQDMLSSMSSLGAMGLSSQGVEHYLPVIADLASTVGTNLFGQPVDLSMASYAVLDASMGLSRMLRTQLRIPPENLVQYGYDANNPSTLLPALEKYSIAQHRTVYNAKGQDVGAAERMATSTWFGASSSWADRWQNFALDIGGYPAFGPDAGALRAGSPFDVARQGLISLNTFWDAHQSELNKLASFLSQTLGQGLKDVGQDALAFAHGVQGSGFPRMLGDMFQSLSHFLSDPHAQANIQQVFTTIGTTVGNLAADLQPKVDAITKAFSEIQKGWSDLTTSLTPTNKSDAKAIGDTFGKWLDDLIVQFGKVFREKEHMLGDLARFMSDLQNGNWGAVGQDLKNLGADYGGDLAAVGGAVANQQMGADFTSRVQQAWQIDQQFLFGGQAGDPGSLARVLSTQVKLAWNLAILESSPAFYQSGRAIADAVNRGLNDQKAEAYAAGLVVADQVLKGIIAVLGGLTGGGTHDSSYRATLRSPGGYNVAGGVGGLY